MRILLISPSPLGDDTARLGGIAGYVADLARALRDKGHRVAVLTSGHAYTPARLGRGEGRCRPIRLGDLEGVGRYQILNSPVLAPSLWQFGAPEAEIRQPTLERAVRRVLDLEQPEVVHIHGLEGLPASVVRRCHRQGRSVLVSLHNHHPFCPQVYLMRGRRMDCTDYEGGQACESCEQRIDIPRERRRRACADAGPPPTITPPPLPPIPTFDDSGEPTRETAALHAGGHSLWQPVEPAAPDPTLCRRVAGRYGVRRRAFVSALNSAHRVLAVSSAVAELAEAMGVDPARIAVEMIGSWAAEAPNRPSAPAHDPAPSGRLRLAFLGFNNYYKGLPMLVDAIGLLPPVSRSRIALLAAGTNASAIRGRAEAIRPGLAELRLVDAYPRDGVPGLLEGQHLGVVPSVWRDNGPQTAIEMRALGVPVLGARIGGIPDIIADGIDGLLFRANDREDLARVLERVLGTPGLTTRLRASVRPWFPMSHHADALCGLYQEALGLASSATTDRLAGRRTEPPAARP
ncbi:MAG: glycosyltransferase [Phycisphaerales bacterium]